MITWGVHNMNQLSTKLQLYNVLDIGVSRIDNIEIEYFRLVGNANQLVITPSDFCDEIIGVQPSVQSLMKNIMPFDCLIPHIKSDHPIGESINKGINKKFTT